MRPSRIPIFQLRPSIELRPGSQESRMVHLACRGVQQSRKAVSPHLVQVRLLAFALIHAWTALLEEDGDMISSKEKKKQREDFVVWEGVAW